MKSDAIRILEDLCKCACVHSDPRECARLRDGPHYCWDLRRLCECVCHDDFEGDDDYDP